MTEDFTSWIGRSITRRDNVTERLVAEFDATLHPFLHKPPGIEAPPGLHWALAPALPRASDLGPDGAEAKGFFLPPIPLPRRMWAGGAIEHLAPLTVGMDVERRSAIADIRQREGKSGPLCIVTVTHEIKAATRTLLREKQELVFRAPGPAGKGNQPVSPGEGCILAWQVPLTPILLFRFSAVTFNGHRIHYDHPYAVEHEAYAGLVVHGPLQASLLLNQAAALLGKTPARFEYRCLAPLIAGGTAEVRSWPEGEGARGVILDPSGVATCEARAVRREEARAPETGSA